MESPKQTPQLRAIFERVVDAPVDSRPALLDELCRSDTALRAEVERLLQHSEDLGEFLERPIASLVPLLKRVVSHEAAGETIGLYRLTERLGEGSFSTVWSAQQTTPIRREVALKILKPGLDVQSIVERFDHERDVLARLEHPNICRIYDAGIHDSGRPYFVMERVKGVSITEHARANAMDSRKIIALMISVAGAVQHAHLQGLIHRDLKPANVLISTIDGNPAPKVIDFGIARIITPDRDAPGTLAIVPSGTPAYMSPEQAMFGPIDGRTDVYSLGVILLELLTNDRCSEDRSPKALAALLDRHRVDLRTSAVVLKAMQSVPSARYSSPSELARDLQRVLDGQQPVARRPRTPVFRRALALSLSAALVLIAIVAIRTLTSSPSMIVTPANATWPEPAHAIQEWRIAPEGNTGWWSTEIDTAARRIFAITSTRRLLEIDLDTGEILRSIRPDGRNVVRCLLSPARHKVAIITEDENGTDQRVLLLDADGDIAKTIPIEGQVHSACFVDSSDTVFAVSRRLDETSRVDFYDLNTGQRLASGPTWNSPNAPNYIVSVRDNRSVIAVSPGGDVVLIDARSGAVVGSLGSGYLSSAVLDMIDETHLAVTGAQGAVIYDIPARRPVLRLAAPHVTARAAATPDGKFILLGTIDQRVCRYDRTTGLPVDVVALDGDPAILETATAIPSESSYLVGSMDGSLRLMRAAPNLAGTRPTSVQSPPMPSTLVQSPLPAIPLDPTVPAARWDQQVIKSGAWNALVPSPANRCVYAVPMHGERLLYELALTNGETLRADSPDGRAVVDVSVSADGKRLAVLTTDLASDQNSDSANAALFVLNASDRVQIARFPISGGYPEFAFIDRRGDRLAISYSGVDSRIECLDVQSISPRSVHRNADPRGFGKPFAPAGDDRSLVIWDSPGRAIRLDCDTGNTVVEFRSSSLTFSSLAVAPEQNRLLLLDGECVRTFDLQTGRLTGVYRSTIPVHIASLSADGQRLYAWAPGDHLFTFDTKTGLPTSIHTKKTNTVTSARFAAADGSLIVCATDGTIRAWNLPD